MDAHRAPATKQNDVAYVDTKAVSDRIRVKQAARSLLLPDISNLAKDLIAIDRTIDDDVSDMNTAWPEFACEGLADMRHRDQLREHPRLGLRFGRRFASALGRRRPRPGDKWLMDEVFIRIRGRQHRLRRKVDQDGHVLDILMQKSGL